MIFQSITFYKENGQLKIVEESNNFLQNNHPIDSIPDGLHHALKETLKNDEVELFDKFISSKESSSKMIKDITLNNCLKECINRFVHDLSDEEKKDIEDKDNFEVTYIQSFYGPPVNLMIKFVVDTRLIPSKDSRYSFNVNEFTPIDENTFVLESYSEEDSAYHNSIGYSYRFIVSGSKENLFYDFGIVDKEKDRNIAKIMDILIHPSGNERSNLAWQCLDHFMLYEVKLAPFDRLNPNNDKLASRDYLQNKNHIVYIARDTNNIVRYIGEGQPDRYHHVNSGVSHVYELNREHFLGSRMDVEIYNKDLTKSEALSIERFLLNKYKKCGLWNKKDYKK